MTDFTDERKARPMIETPEWMDRLVEEVAKELDDGEVWRSQVEAAIVAVPADADWDSLRDRLAVRRLRETVLPLQEYWPEEVGGQVVAAVEGVIAALKSGEGPEAAAEAAWRAAVSAWSAAAEEAAWRAARSAAIGWSTKSP